MNKLLFLCNSSKALYNFRIHIIAHFQKMGYQVLAVAPDDGGAQDLAKENISYLSWPLHARGTNPVQELQSVLALATIINREKPNLIIAYTIKPILYGILCSTFLGIPCVAVLTGLGYIFISKSKKNAIIKILATYALKRCRAIWFLNGDDKQYFLQKRLIRTIDEKKCKIMPGEGVDTHFYSCKPGATNTTPKSGLHFLMLSRLYRDKGVLEYIQAAYSIQLLFPTMHFRLAGSWDTLAPGAIKEDTIKKATEAGYLQYLGNVQDIRYEIEKADFVVLSSYREGLPRSLLEAGSMGKPLIATDVPGNRELVIEGWNGFLAQAKSADSLIQAICRAIATKPDVFAIMGKRSRDLVIKKFDISKVIQFYEREVPQLFS